MIGSQKPGDACISALSCPRHINRFLKTLLKYFTVCKAANELLLISTCRKLTITPGQTPWIAVVCNPNFRSLWTYAHQQGWKWKALGRKRMEEENNYSAYFFKWHLLLLRWSSIYRKAKPRWDFKCTDTSQPLIFQVVLRHPLLPGRIKPIPLGENSPNFRLSKLTSVQGLL